MLVKSILIPLSILILIGAAFGLALRLDEKQKLERSRQNIVYYDCIITTESGQVITIQTSTEQDYWFTRTFPSGGVRIRDVNGLESLITGPINSIIKRLK